MYSLCNRMEEELKEYLQKKDYSYSPLSDEHIVAVHELFFKDIIVENPAYELLGCYATYYRIKKDYANATKYYLAALNYGNSWASFSLAQCYYEQDDYDNAVKYWQLDMQQGGSHSSYSMNSLGVHYFRQNDNVNAIKYYLMAIEHNSTHAMHNMALYYKTQQDYDNAFKYWCMAADHGHYSYGERALRCFKTNELVQYGILFANKILNREHNTEIISFITHFANIMNSDMVNLIINMDDNDPIVHKFKKLLICL